MWARRLSQSRLEKNLALKPQRNLNGIHDEKQFSIKDRSAFINKRGTHPLPLTGQRLRRGLSPLRTRDPLLGNGVQSSRFRRARRRGMLMASVCTVTERPSQCAGHKPRVYERLSEFPDLRGLSRFHFCNDWRAVPLG